MKKRNTTGMDMGDRNPTICTLDSGGKVISRNTGSNTDAALRKCFRKLEPALFSADETGYCLLLPEVQFSALTGRNPFDLGTSNTGAGVATSS